MPASKAEIIARLQKEILPLQGFKHMPAGMEVDTGLGPINDAFPNASFPLGAIHEFCYHQPEAAAATTGFMATLLSACMQNKKAILWISASRTIFPPGLPAFGIVPENVIFIDLQKDKDVLWALEEALACEGLAAVVGECAHLGFTASRRLQLIVEKSRVTGFILRRHTGKMNTTASVTRWQVSSLPGDIPGDMPGIGFPKWQVALLKVRNGKPGSWKVGWRNGQFVHASQQILKVVQQHKQTG